MFVLLRHVNQYYQEGGYFCGAFETERAAIAASPTGKIGRPADMPNVWYEVEEFEPNVYTTVALDEDY